jgi:hypothetical protein
MTQLMTNINVAIVNRNVDFFDTETTFGVEGQPVGFDRRVLVQSGKIYVFIDGMYDSYGHQQVYYEGEMVYVSNAKADVNRKIVILRRRGARIEIAGNCGLSGVTTTAAEMASVNISLTFDLVNPILVLQQYASRLDQINVGITAVIENALIPHLNDEIWRTPADSFLSHLVTSVNLILNNAGIQIIATEAAIRRSVPDAVNTIVTECRLGEHRLIDMMDGGRFEQLYDPTLNGQRVMELQKDPTHGFLDTGDITTFVNGVTLPNVVRGRTFFEVLMHKAKSNNPDTSAIKFFAAKYAGPMTHAYVDNYLNEMQANANPQTGIVSQIPQLEMSYGIIRNNF